MKQDSCETSQALGESCVTILSIATIGLQAAYVIALQHTGCPESLVFFFKLLFLRHVRIIFNIKDFLLSQINGHFLKSN